MKTKTFLLLCLSLGIGLTQLSAQNGTNGSGNVVTEVKWGWYTPIYCNGVLVDELVGIGDIRVIDHFVSGVWQWENVWYTNGVGKSTWTNETFTFKELDKWFNKRDGTYIGTTDTQVKGDKGTVYNMTFLWFEDGTMGIQNTSCSGSAK